MKLHKKISESLKQSEAHTANVVENDVQQALRSAFVCIVVVTI